jgi:hypothetical protein
VWKVTLMVVEENKKVRGVCKGRHISIDVVVINVLLITKTCFLFYSDSLPQLPLCMGT